MLTAAELGALLHPPLRALVLESVDSTNTALMRMAATGAAEGTVLLAQAQTAGRGQRGRDFYSPAGCGIYMSLLLRPKMPPEDVLAITPAAAVAAAQAVEAATGRRADIKWVNDIQIDGKKVCGILTEAASSSGTLDCAVCGIGINLFPPLGGYPEALRDRAGALFDAYPGDERTAALAADVLNRLWELCSLLPARDFLDEYRARSVLTGRSVTVNGRGEGVVEGVDRDFSLLIRFGNGETTALRSASELKPE